MKLNKQGGVMACRSKLPIYAIWQEIVANYVGGITVAVSTRDVMREALNLDLSNINPQGSEAQRVGKIMRGLGYSKQRPELATGAREWVWKLESNSMWREMIAKYVRGIHGAFSTSEVMRDALKIDMSSINPRGSEAQRVGRMLRGLGYNKHRLSHGAREWVWKRDEVELKGGRDGMPSEAMCRDGVIPEKLTLKANVQAKGKCPS